MPETEPPNDDAFADLYGRLPDPRTTSDGTPRAASTPDDVPAPSRRAAREARRAATGESAPQTDPAGPAAAASAPEPQHAAEPQHPAEPRRPAPSQRPSQPQDTPRPDSPTPPERAPQAARLPEPPRAARPERPRTSESPRASETAPEPERVREPVLAGGWSVATPARSSSPAPASAPSGSLEDLFTGETATEHAGSPVPRRRRRLGGWIALAISVIVIGALVLVGVNLWSAYGERVQSFFGASEPYDYESGLATGEARVTIVSGDTGQSVSPKLFDAGVTKTANALYQYMIENGVVFTFQPGVYRLQQQMTSGAVLQALQDPANRLDNSVQLREGLTVEQSLQTISDQLGMPLADLQAAVADPSAYGVSASSLEGWIFPATYDFDEGVTATDVVTRMVQRTIQSLDSQGVPVDDRQRILTVASIIEREARFPDDFYKVSRVIENRLDPSNQETFGRLEMDSTVQYGAGEMDSGSVSTSTDARNSDNPWNTYMYPGLPAGPIANPGDRAIDAAMHPADGPWLYFVTVNLNTGETVFTSTYAEHLQAVEQWRAWCADNPDAGC